MAAQADPAGCLYAVLGVRRDADTQTIRSAYRRLAVRYHPDKNREPGAEEMFKAVARAYEVLADADSRALYDAYGMKGVRAARPAGARMEAQTAGMVALTEALTLAATLSTLSSSFPTFSGARTHSHTSSEAQVRFVVRQAVGVGAVSLSRTPSSAAWAAAARSRG